MQSSNHIGKIVRQHASAVENGKSPARKQKNSDKKSPFTSVPKHRAFVPMVTIWGGLLLALVTAVLPDQPIARVSSLTGVYLPLLLTRIVLSAGIGLAGALLGYIVSSALSNRAKLIDGDGGLVSAFKSRDLQPINPVADLGSESLDAPLRQPAKRDLGEAAEFFEMPQSDFQTDTANETSSEASGEATNKEREPNLGELSQRGFEMEAPEDVESDDGRHSKGKWAFTRKHFKEALIDSCEGATCEAAFGAEFATCPPAPSHTPNRAPEGPASVASLTPENTTPRSSKPRALDLDEFATIPGRNAVWVEGLGEEETRKSNAHSAPPPAPEPRVQDPENALEKLRQKPAEHLSLVEMVERFAGALHDHQAQERARVTDGAFAHEAALAEALKALSLFTQAGFDQDYGDQGSRDQGSRDQATRTHALGSEFDQTEDQLRSALARLQDIRGAA